MTPARANALFADPRPVNALAALLAEANLKVDYTVLNPGRVRAGYVDTTAELGHWLEICQLQAQDIEFFAELVTQSA